MLQKTPNNSVEKLDLIDAIQRLGVAYHFDSEIEATLCNIYDSYHELLSKDHQDTNDLRVVALRFRLLRQQGYHVSSGKYFTTLTLSFQLLKLYFLLLKNKLF